MNQTSIKSWWLLALCGVLNAIIAVTILFVLSPDGSPVLRAFLHARSAVPQLGVVALAAGACMIAAVLFGSRGRNSWLLVLNGLACSAFGLLLSLGATRPIAFRTIALFIVAMAVSIGLYELAAALSLRGHRADEWLLGAAGVVSVGFAGVFLGFALRWIALAPSPSAQTFLWLGSYFGFSAVCMAGLALRQNSLRADLHRISSRALPTG